MIKGYDLLQDVEFIGAADLEGSNKELWLVQLPRSEEMDWQQLVHASLEVPEGPCTSGQSSVLLPSGVRCSVLSKECQSGIAVAPATRSTTQAVGELVRVVTIARCADVPAPPSTPQQAQHQARHEQYAGQNEEGGGEEEEEEEEFNIALAVLKAEHDRASTPAASSRKEKPSSKKKKRPKSDEAAEEDHAPVVQEGVASACQEQKKKKKRKKSSGS